MKLKNKCALITGGTAGIGAAMVREFVKEGAQVAFVGRNAERGDALARDTGACFFPADIADPAVPDAIVERMLEEFGRLNILVNNAGIITRKTTEETALDDWEHIMAVNARAAFLFSRAALPHLRAQRGGVILNLVSSAGLFGSPKMVAYAASKGAMLQMTRAMARDHAYENIRVVAICPADVDTPMVEQEAQELGRTPDAHRQILNNAYPIGRIGTPEEIARAAVFVVSDDCPFLTGSAILIDGALRA
ncbi:MAG TPA: SDR family oxidoreductase [Anaerolineae bacterium]|nr:SDR family oxidoreductase [Anaerolineae bacterium]